MSTKEIRDIYSKILIQRDQVSKRTKEEVASTMASQLTRIFDKYWKVLQNPKTSVGQQDEVKREMSTFLHTIMIDSDHDVIMELSHQAEFKFLKDKKLQELKNA